MNDPQPLPSTPHSAGLSVADSAQPVTTPFGQSDAADVTGNKAATSGPRFGRFAVQRFHAKGGLGEVHVAIDEELCREVALKKIQARAAGEPAARRRFVNEAAITARLEHPGVVPIYGLVQDDAGQPCYAMRFIQGESLAAAVKRFHAADERRGLSPPDGAAADGADKPRRSLDYAGLEFRQLLQRFISVCQTMAYAHSKQIIHRDIKPTNIMLGPFGETLVVDWGLARDLADAQAEAARLDQEQDTPLATTMPFVPAALPDELIFTQQGQALGTPGYMSPEQAAGRLNVLGPRSDVYSLGATLYEMLTGDRPVRTRDVCEALQKTQAGDFRPPRKVNHHVPKVLDAICLKAMALAPEKRYGSAADLAADLEHWLADEPVAAYPEPWMARLRRWQRRHRGLAGVAAATLLLGVVALAGFAVLVDRQREVLTEKNAELKAMNASERAAKDEAVEARGHERQAKQKARRAIEVIVNDDMVNELTRQPREYLTPERREMLAALVGYYQDFAAEEAATEQERERQGEAYFRTGRIHYVFGKLEDGEQALRQAAKIQEKLAKEFPAKADYRLQSSTSWHNLGVICLEMGQRPEAEAAFREAIRLREQLIAESPDLPASRGGLAASFNSLGRVRETEGRRAEAETLYRRAAALQESLLTVSPDSAALRRDLANTHNNLGILLMNTGRWEEAEASYGRSLALRDKLAAEAPRQANAQMELATTHHNLAILFNGTRRPTEAEAAYRRAIAIKEKVVAAFPNVPLCRQELGASCNGLGTVLSERGKHAEAEPVIRRAVDIREKLAAEFPSIPGYQCDLSLAYTNLGIVLGRLNQPAEAAAMHRKALAQQEKLVAAYPGVPDYRKDYAGSCVNFGHLLQDGGQVEESLPWYAKAIAVLESAPIEGALQVRERLFLRNAYIGRAQAFDKLARHAEAAASWAKAAELDDGQERSGLRVKGAVALARGGDTARAVALANEVTQMTITRSFTIYDLGCIYALAAAQASDPAEREQLAARAMEMLRKAQTAGHFKQRAKADRLAKDRDLDGLRERTDFKALLREVTP